MSRERDQEEPDREERITMEIVVDAYGSDERAIGWYCYLENTLRFPFKAKFLHRRQTSPLRPNERVEVTGMADSDECRSEMFVLIEWDDDELAVPLEQLKPLNADDETVEAIEDWQYWVRRGYQF
jgi:hypothetical protein